MATASATAADGGLPVLERATALCFSSTLISSTALAAGLLPFMFWHCSVLGEAVLDIFLGIRDGKVGLWFVAREQI
ncbi:hypothetical protein AKJ16_DCAP21471 [Drosera capensis]